MTEDDTLVLRPEVVAFVEEVRRHLADLDDETRDDLLDGLDADLAEQLADGADLGDPAGYAAELRSAAGLPEPRRRRRSIRVAPAELLDDARARFLAVAESPRFRPAWELLVTLRPVWWVARAWVAVTALDVAVGPYEYISVVPTLAVPGLGPLALVAAIVVSTLIGLGRLWPASLRASQRRYAVLALNTAAVVTPLFLSIPVPAYLGYDHYDPEYYGSAGEDYYQRGLFADGDPVINIFAYDAAGKPIPQVQLVDQDGRPLSVRLRDAAVYDDDSEGLRVPCPARNGGAAVTNAFPFAYVRTSIEGRCTAALAARSVPPTPPLASLPPITLPGR
ncbi:hypothetical protein [Nocardioides sp. LML1-1-1.1]|uniref:hypothetical protein n=1 Tax=Nocardioides sp. LML1-1-1.1 TaxID=3135248 RepID=UPI0034433A7A